LREIIGILNGTTNYILTKMSEEGKDYEEALNEAQEKGYAEADPSKDIDGFDAFNKILFFLPLPSGRRSIRIISIMRG